MTPRIFCRGLDARSIPSPSVRLRWRRWKLWRRCRRLFWVVSVLARCSRSRAAEIGTLRLAEVFRVYIQVDSYRRIGWLAVLLFPCLSLSSSRAQTIPRHPPVLSSPSPKASMERDAAIRKNSRFLGWKFARLAHQDTRRWRRDNPQGRDLASATHSYGLTHSASSSPGMGFGNAGFTERPVLPAGFIPTAITSGDFNGDGKLDFAISNGGDNTIYVFLGNGDNTFKVPEILYTQGQSPSWITAVRLRKNGPFDLAVTDGDSSTVEVFPGNGDGTFQPST